MEIGKWVDRRQRRRRRSSSSLPWCSCCVFVGLLALFQEYAFVGKALLSLSRKPLPRGFRVACGQQAPDSLSSRSELYQLLQQREHVLRRPDMYIGPVEPRNETAWLVKGRKIVESSLLLSPGLVFGRREATELRKWIGVRSLKIETVAVHGGDQHDPGHGAIFPPITTATSFVQTNLGQEGRFAYSRCGNPTRSAYETAIADLEGGLWATATASGMAATALALELLEPGSHVLAMRGLYGGTVRLFEKVRSTSQNLQFTYLDLNDVESVCSKIQENTKMIWVESPTNPLLTLVDIPKLVQAVRKCEKDRGSNFRILICADNTFATAWNQQPLKMGVDIVMISASKYIGGHSDMTGGALVVGQNQDLLQRLNALAKSVGAIASPFEAYLALRGMKTLAVRMERQCSNAQKVAEFLASHDNVTEVHYPGLSNHPQHALCQRQMRSGGAVVTVRLKGVAAMTDLDVMHRFFSRLKIWVLAESLGGVESMINHSASMSHGSMTQAERAEVGVYDTTLRLSVGIEDVTDLVDDLSQALSA